MYDDELLKLDFYKQYIIKEFIRNGIYPNDNAVQQKINDIDLSLALFKHLNIKEGINFDTEQYNKEIMLLYQDLCFLYNLLQQIIITKYNGLQQFAYSHLEDLNNKAAECALRVKEEIGTTSIGNTLFFKHNGFNISSDNNILTIDCGAVKLNPFTKIACLCDIDNIDYSHLICDFKNDTDEFTVPVYNYNQDTIIIPGDANFTNFTMILNNNQIINGPIQITTIETINMNDEYLIFGAKDNINIMDYTVSSNSLVNKPTDSGAVSVNTNSTIDFYVIGANKITFWFSEKPIHANFSLDNYIVTITNHIQHFTMDVNAGFSFKFTIDTGNVYAIKSNGIVQNNNLYYEGNTIVKDFYVEHYGAGDGIDYNLKLNIYVNDDSIPIVNSVTVKELSTGEV